MYIPAISVLILGLLSGSLALDCQSCASFDYSKTGLTWSQQQLFPKSIDGYGEFFI
jgi:hypothetical protein